MIAAKEGKKDIIKCLVESKANIDARDRVSTGVVMGIAILSNVVYLPILVRFIRYSLSGNFVWLLWSHVCQSMRLPVAIQIRTYTYKTRNMGLCIQI